MLGEASHQPPPGVLCHLSFGLAATFCVAAGLLMETQKLGPKHTEASESQG